MLAELPLTNMTMRNFRMGNTDPAMRTAWMIMWRMLPIAGNSSHLNPTSLIIESAMSVTHVSCVIMSLSISGSGFSLKMMQGASGSGTRGAHPTAMAPSWQHATDLSAASQMLMVSAASQRAVTTRIRCARVKGSVIATVKQLRILCVTMSVRNTVRQKPFTCVNRSFLRLRSSIICRDTFLRSAFCKVVHSRVVDSASARRAGSIMSS
mmetsp:Transcript_38337/g.121019  ORF Transcript_38337/g.121019 Transcript_38337/m.121019 type:complete len:209 (+) Transcript_38337:630-1256(+)